MMESERVGVLEAEMRGHFKADEVGFARINADTSEIKLTLREMCTDLKSAVERIHGRIDDEAGKARHNLSNAVQAIQGDIGAVEKTSRMETKLAMDLAVDVRGDLQTLEPKIKNWIYGGAVVFATAVIGWLADHFFIGKAS